LQACACTAQQPGQLIAPEFIVVHIGFSPGFFGSGASDFGWITRGEGLLQLSIQLFVEFPLFALLSRLVLLRHYPISTFGALGRAMIGRSLWSEWCADPRIPHGQIVDLP
jgi:hypothetical protein